MATPDRTGLGTRRSGYGLAELHPRDSSANLADILERVLDKGIVIAGDIQINLLEIELLTIKLRLLVASVARAREMGISWWETDQWLTGSEPQLQDENRRLRERVERRERLLGDGRDSATVAGEETAVEATRTEKARVVTPRKGSRPARKSGDARGR